MWERTFQLVGTGGVKASGMCETCMENYGVCLDWGTRNTAVKPEFENLSFGPKLKDLHLNSQMFKGL